MTVLADYVLDVLSLNTIKTCGLGAMIQAHAI